VRVLVVEDEPFLAEAIRAGLRLEAIAADTVGDGFAALDQLAVHAYDVVSTGEHVARSRRSSRRLASGSTPSDARPTATDATCAWGGRSSRSSRSCCVRTVAS